MRVFQHLLQLYWVLFKEFAQMWANRSAVVIIIGMPLVQLLVLPLTVDFEVKEIRLCIIDQDQSPASRTLIDKFHHNRYFRVSRSTEGESPEAAATNSEYDAILNIPAHFGRCLMQGSPAALSARIDAVDAVKASITFTDIRELVTAYMTQSYGGQQNVITTQFWYNPGQDYQLFMVPGIIAFLVTMVGIYLVAMSVVREKQSGTIRQLQLMPISSTTVLGGKLISIWMVSMGIFLLGMLISSLVYGIVVKGDFVILLVFNACYLLPVLLLGFVLASYCKNQFQAMLLAFFFVLIFILTGGLFSPISSMPKEVQPLVKMNPVHLLIEVMRMVIIKGGRFADISVYFLSCLYQVIVLLPVCIFRYRRY